jgi:YVTN family beta-propeller protein
MARPAEAAPFAYVANSGSDIVSVIDTANNTVVATVTVGNGSYGLAITPDVPLCRIATLPTWRWPRSRWEMSPSG